MQPPQLIVNESVVAFGGRTWWVIGSDGQGVWPQPDSVTLLQKENSDENRYVPFRAGQDVDPGDGSLVEHWIHNEDGTPSYTSTGTPSGTVDVPTTDWFAANPSGMAAWKTPNEYLGSTLQQNLANSASQLPGAEQAVINPRTLAGGGTYNNLSSDELAGPAAEDQLFWALSGREIYQLTSTVRSYETYWWLRGVDPAAKPSNPYFETTSVAGFEISPTGTSMSTDNCRAYGDVSTRPAMSLNLSDALFASSASADGKGSAVLGSGLTAMSAPATDAAHPVKFTIIDDELSLDVVATRAQSTQSAPTLSFSYEHASVGGDMYLSALLTDSNDAVAYYGKLAGLSSADAGTLSVPLTRTATCTPTSAAAPSP